MRCSVSSGKPPTEARLDESIQRQLEQPQVGTPNLSEAIRIGARMITEERVSYRFCALGCAFAGFHGRPMTEEEGGRFCYSDKTPEAAIAEALNIPERLAQQISARHFQGYPARHIADWLQSEGY